MTADMFLTGRPFTIEGKVLEPDSSDPIPLLRICAQESTLTLFLDAKSLAAMRAALEAICPSQIEPPTDVIVHYAEAHADELASEVAL